MNIVCDTNILVSGVLFGGNARKIIRAASQGLVVNYISTAILREFEDVLKRPKFGLQPEQVVAITALVRDTFEMDEPDFDLKVIPNDPDDDRILEAAIEAQAKYIISGDKHLLKLGRWEDVGIVTAAAFVRDNLS